MHRDPHGHCPVRARFERDYDELVTRQRYAAVSAVDLAGADSTAFWKAQSASRGLLAEIRISREALAAHRVQHGC